MKEKNLPRLRTAIGLVAVGATALLTACGPASSGGGVAQTQESEIVTLSPEASGPIDKFVWATNSEPASMDWIYNADTSTGQIMSNVCEGLFRLNVDMAPEPALAESVDVPDELTRVYTLREGVTFHDGSELTADDVVFSLNRNLDEELGSYWGGPFEHVTEITATGDLEVTIKLSEPDALLDFYLSSPAGIVDSKSTVEELGSKYGTPSGGVNCVGPFALGEWNAGQSITLVKDENYFDEAHKAKADIVEFQFVRDPAALTNGLLAGSIDGAWELPPAAITRLATAPNGTVYQGPSTQGYNAIVMNDDGALADPIVRQAISMAIDREAIIKAAVAGAAGEQRAPAVPGSWGYEKDAFQNAWDDIEVGQTDPEAAKELLATTELPNKKVVIASTTAEAQTPIIAAELQQAINNLGMEAEIRSIPADQYYAVYTDESAREGIDLYLTSWGTDFADPTQIYEYFTTGNIYNFTNLSDPELDRLVSEAAATDDLAERAELIIQAQKIVVDYSLWIPIYSPNNTVFLSDRITGTPVSYMQLHRPWAAAIGSASAE